MKTILMFLVVIVAASLPAGAQDEDAMRLRILSFLQDPPKPAETEPKTQAQESPVKPRGALKDEQEGAPRHDSYTLDPKYKGFIPIPNTPAMIKFNAKPRVDMTMDNQNAGDDNRFITARIPVESDPAHGGGGVFNINAKGSQLSMEVSAPEVDGSPRFYYQNDFYGSGSGEFPMRVRQLYGEIHNVIVGMTFSVFEDPDVWPDTVDYEGPNSAVFARRPLARIMLPIDKEWHVNLGIEQPESEIDSSIDPGGSAVNHWPDVGANVRWESAELGHVQAAMILRQLGFNGEITGNQRTMGWGINLSAVLTPFESGSAQLQVTFGEGIFRYMNDDFFNNDAAFDEDGDLTAIPCTAFMLGYTHKWTPEWRSTVSYGYVVLDNEASQDPTAYHKTHYASLNAIYQLRTRLSVGLETLYGSKEQEDGDRGSAFRVMVGMVYSLF